MVDAHIMNHIDTQNMAVCVGDYHTVQYNLLYTLMQASLV